MDNDELIIRCFGERIINADTSKMRLGDLVEAMALMPGKYLAGLSKSKFNKNEQDVLTTAYYKLLNKYKQALNDLDIFLGK